MGNSINKKSRVLIIGATGRIGSYIIKELDKNNEGIIVRLSSKDKHIVEKWQHEGREATVLDLDKPDTFLSALEDVDRVFLLTSYTSDMLRQSKMLIDVSVDAGVKHMVHLGVFTSRRDLIPHFNWHDLIESYIESSGLSWTHIHPNVIADSSLVVDPPIKETGSFTVFNNDMPQGWFFASDIGAASAAVLREGPKKHAGANYFLSIELLTGSEVAKILSEVSGKEIKCNVMNAEALKVHTDQIPSVSIRTYMESANITMQLSTEGRMKAQEVIRDDVQTILGRPGLTMAEWAKQNLA
ncbi:NmrA family NAD(P)-binding protein [Flavobacterium aquicola]|uniref:Uncharacterized protein YbjT (DUF2867 family) n=1 Tax=Flavobacterium aquicola TaxID=1682742 RepID=A0A3E0EJT5_9FLAO|nr:NmrA family NAD(P)-binding protein [Flavobacterium aquicola]REG98013.1 uncharacterized protein YbjT (DUF2867 family) [Flavobacterium aquicola]